MKLSASFLLAIDETKVVFPETGLTAKSVGPDGKVESFPIVFINFEGTELVIREKVNNMLDMLFLYHQTNADLSISTSED